MWKMPQVRFIDKNFLDFVASLPAMKLDILYTNPFVCQAILRKKETSYGLINPTFQTNLLKYIINSGVFPREPMPSTLKLPSFEELEAYALGQWELFLLQLIYSGKAEKLTNFSSFMIKIFQRGLLSQRDKEAPRLIDGNFQFLPMDTNGQLWYIIRERISDSEVFFHQPKLFLPLSQLLMVRNTKEDEILLE